MSTYEDRVKQYNDQDLPKAQTAHIAAGIRKKFGKDFDFSTLTDDQVVQRHYSRFGSEMDPDSYGKKLVETYAADFTPPEAPKKTLVERGEDVVEGAKDFAKGVVPYLVPEAPKVAAAIAPKAALGVAAKAVAKSIPVVSQASFAAGHAINAAVDTQTAHALEQTAAELPVPDLETISQDFYAKLQPGLSARGVPDDQIRAEAKSRAMNIVHGHEKTTESIQQDVMRAQQAAAVSEPAAAAADVFFLGVGAPAIEGALNKALGKMGISMATKPVAQSAIGTIANHVKTGVLVGAPGMGIHGAVEHGIQAATENKTPQEIGAALVQGGKQGAILGAAGGAIIGGAAGVLENTVGAVVKPLAKKSAAKAEAARVAEVERTKSAARLIDQTAQKFNPHKENIPLDGSPSELATTIIQSKHGEDAAMSEAGLRAASQIADRITAYQSANQALERNVAPELGPTQGRESGLQPVGAPLTPEGGLAPENIPPSMRGPLGEQPTGFVPPEGVPPMAGLEGAPVGAASTPFAHEGVAPAEGVPPVVQLGKPLGVIERAGVEPPVAEPHPRLGPEAPPVPPPSLETVAADVARERPVAPPNRPGPITPEEMVAQIVRDRQKPVESTTPPAPEAPPAATPEPAPQPETARPAPPEPVTPPTAEPVSKPVSAAQAIKELKKTEATLSESSDGSIHIERLGSPKGQSAKPGAAMTALSEVISKADEHQLPITTRIVPADAPNGGKIPVEKQLAWYAARGFTLVESTKLPEGQLATATLIRQPVPKKMSMKDAQQAMMDKLKKGNK